MVRIG